MAAKSYFQRLLVLAMAELSVPLDADKMKAAWDLVDKKISKSRIAYQWYLENP